MRPDLVLIPTITVHPDRVCFYNEVNWSPAKPSVYDSETGEKLSRVKFDHLLNSKRTAEGQVSDIAKRKINKAIEYLLTLSANKTGESRISGKSFTFKIAFITLTLPSLQVHSDNEIKNQCLNQFIVEIKKRYHVKNFVWRAEKQKNGNLHFHLLIDKFIPYLELRDRWNRIINKLGYVDRFQEKQKEFYKNGFRVSANANDKRSKEEQYKAYLKAIKEGFQSPNSTDIHSVRKVKDIKRYCAKYMTKDDDGNKLFDKKTGEPIVQEGRIWSCNHELSNPTGARLQLDYETDKVFRDVIENSDCNIYKSDYFSVYFIDFQDLPGFGGKLIFDEFIRYLRETFNYEFQDRLAI